MKKIILFELNEVPFEIIDHFIKKNPNSTLAKTLPSCKQYKTVTKDQGHLHPWVTWPTLHRGIPNTKHFIKDFGEDLSEVNKQFPSLWSILKRNQINTGVFSSMHSYPVPKDYKEYSFYIPDPFAASSETHPKSIQSFQDFNLKMSRKSGRNVDTGIDKKSALKMGLSLPFIGIKPSSILEILKQLQLETKHDWIKTRRRVYQSLLSFDVFMKLLNKKQPDFCTYFTNHVASIMHRYWAATFPEQFNKDNLLNKWINTYKDEVDFAMSIFDKFLLKLTQFVDKNNNYTLIVASSMGQKATSAEIVKSEVYLKNIASFMRFLGLNDNEWEQKPAMHPQYNVQVNEKLIEKMQTQLSKIKIGENPINFRCKEGGFFSIDFGQINLEEATLFFENQIYNFDSIGLENQAIDEGMAGTAYHIPEGILITYDSSNIGDDSREEIDTTCIAPTILENFNVDIPSYMSNSRIPNFQVENIVN